MPVIKVNDQQYSLRPGLTRLGSGSEADVRLESGEGQGVQAILELDDEPGGGAVIRRATNNAVVRVNGVALGVEPTPLMHGDKVEIGGQEILYADDSKVGATQFVAANDVAAMVQRRPGAGRATVPTGGRLVSLVDGKEYVVPQTGIVIGRDAGADIVVAEGGVSRKHAEIGPTATGYEITDLSANGLLVNGVRVDGRQALARADIIKIGSEEFRFYADLAPMAAAPRAPAAPASPAPAARAQTAASSAPTPAVSATPAVAAASLSALSAPPPAPAPPLIDSRPVLAILEVTNEGINKGHVYEVRTPLAHVGRGGHNDVVISEDSVSDTHAKLQRRDDGWYVVDAGSTNGTYVGGSRITGERRLDGTPDLRFGGVKTVFRVSEPEGGLDASKGTRAIASVDRSRPVIPAAAPAAPAAPATLAAAARSPAPPRDRPGVPIWVWIALGIAIVAAGTYLASNR